MSSIASLGRVTSGLKAAQTGLQVTGHNIANVNTKGYTRQQALQHDSGYMTVGQNGGRLQQVGMGVSVTEIRQIRDEFADKRFRTENSVLNFYMAKQSATSEIESILDEPYGASISGMLEDFWKQAQKLSTNPSGVEERLAFIQTADVLMKRANQIMGGLGDYQQHVNTQVKDAIKEINDMLYSVRDLNDKIAKAEVNGDRANDLRDQRNLLLDELSNYIDIDYSEDKDGRVNVKTEGRNLIDGPFVVELQGKVLPNGSGFVVPVWSDTGKEVYNLNAVVSSSTGDDTGYLKGLLIARGPMAADSNTSWDNIALNNKESVDKLGNSFVIPKLQKQLSELVGEIANVVNDTLSGTGIGDHKGAMGIPMFVPKNSTDGTKLPAQPKLEDYPDDVEAYNQAMKDYRVAIKKHLTAGNIQVNPELLQDGGYNKLGTVDGDPDNIGDNSVITKLLDEWSKTREWPREPEGGWGTADGKAPASAPNGKNSNFMDFYAEIVSEVGSEGSEYKNKIKEKNTLVTSIDNDRMAMGAVSQDEEMSNMLKYQYAYNAAARMVNMLDGMMDTIINKL